MARSLTIINYKEADKIKQNTDYTSDQI